MKKWVFVPQPWQWSFGKRIVKCSGNIVLKAWCFGLFEYHTWNQYLPTVDPWETSRPSANTLYLKLS